MVPARGALALWARVDWPRERRALRGADVVHGTNFTAPPTGWPTVLSVHDTTPFLRPGDCGRTARSFAPVVRRLVRHGAWVHALTEAVAGQLREILRTERVRAVHLGPAPIALPVPHPLRPARPYVLALGTLEPRKNLARLVSAYALAQRSLPELALVLAGSDGTAVREIDAAIASLPSGALVVRTGWVDPGGRADLLGHATVLAYPSLDEGFGLPVLEAMAQSVPVVAASIPAISETAGGAALLVDPTDTDGLAQALLVACRDASLRADLIRRGSVNVTRFSWRETANGLVALYREAMAEGRRA